MKTKLIQATLAAVLLGGCAMGEQLRVTGKILGDDGTAPEMMTNQHILGWVYFDEAHYDSARALAKNPLYVSGIRKDAGNYGYRYVAISSSRLEEGTFLFKNKSSQLYVTGAMVPDHIGRLRAADIVELRSIAPWDTLVNFTKDGEGQIVTRVLCRKAQPDWQKCVDALPRFHEYKATGQTGRPFPASVKDYPENFQFSRFYDDNGKLLKPLP